MPKRKAAQPSPEQPGAEKSPGRSRRAARLARRTAQGALLAMSLTVSQLRWEETVLGDSFFDRTLVDKLQEPLTRFHE